jgi:hypothetical protein
MPDANKHLMDPFFSVVGLPKCLMKGWTRQGNVSHFTINHKGDDNVDSQRVNRSSTSITLFTERYRCNATWSLYWMDANEHDMLIRCREIGVRYVKVPDIHV